MKKTRVKFINVMGYDREHGAPVLDVLRDSPSSKVGENIADSGLRRLDEQLKNIIGGHQESSSATKSSISQISSAIPAAMAGVILKD